MALSSVARGADGLMFFRWRPAHFGAEIYWLGLLDHDDVPRRRFAEACAFGKDLAALRGGLLGTRVRMDVGIAGGDFDNQECYRTYPMGLPSPEEAGGVLHRTLYQQGIAAGFIHPADDLTKLRVLYVPHFMMWDEAWTANVRSFVEGGGTLIVGALTGTRDASNHVHRELAPLGGLAELLGVRVEEFGRVAASGSDGLFEPPAKAAGLGPARQGRLPACSVGRTYKLRIAGEEFAADHLYEKLLLEPDVTPLACWSTRWLAGQPALTIRHVGQGRAMYLATYLTEGLAAKLVEMLQTEVGLAPLLPELPAGVEVTERCADDGRRLLFVINTSDGPVEVVLPMAGEDLLTGKTAKGMLPLPAYGAAVIRV